MRKGFAERALLRGTMIDAGAFLSTAAMPKTTMSKKTLNKTNLEALGTEKLAALLIEVSTGSADIKRRLRLELSHNLGAAELAHDVRKRLTTLRNATSYVSWRKRKALVKDLETQVSMIVDKVAPDDSTAAFDLLWDFIEIAPSVFGRVDDSKGEIGGVFRDAITQFDTIGPKAGLDTDVLADRVWTALQDNTYGEWEGIVALLAPTLGQAGLAQLQLLVEAYADAPTRTDTTDHDALQFLRQLRSGDSYVSDRKARFVKGCLQEIAAVTGDTQAYIAHYSDADLQRKDTAAEVATLMLADGKPQAALDALLRAEQDRLRTGHDPTQDAWDTAYIAVLTDLGRVDEAQDHHWTCFCDTLNDTHLRAHLKQLPDFEDVVAEDQAKAHVLQFPRFPVALQFCLKWPDLVTAAQLIHDRAHDINGEHCALLAPAAEALRTRHPLTAVTLWRAMIDFALQNARTSRYGYAADHLADCAAVDAEITDYGSLPSHADYLQNLQEHHSRKSGFWAKVW